MNITRVFGTVSRVSLFKIMGSSGSKDLSSAEDGVSGNQTTLDPDGFTTLVSLFRSSPLLRTRQRITLNEKTYP